MTGTELYERTLAYDYGDIERSDLMKKVWSVTPWMIDYYTGDTERDIREWLYSNVGDQAFPIHGREGCWQFGSATIHGWTWLGFSSEELLDKFLKAFPQA